MEILFYLALILFAGLACGRAVKQIKLPNVTGYLIAGLLLGPYVFKIISSETVSQFRVITEMALAFIAFSIGAELNWPSIKQVGVAPVVIAIFEALTASVFVTVILLIFGFPTEVALLLGAIASATAPAATIMVINQYRAKGPVTKTLLSVVALDDAIALIAFGFAVAAVNSRTTPVETNMLMSILTPCVEIIGAIVVGAILGLLFNFPLRFFKKDSNRLIITCGFVFFGSAIASLLGLSSLLLCMSMGITVVNTLRAGSTVFKLVDGITPPIYLMFFVLSGADLDISILPSIGLIGILYIVFRASGKVLGAYAGSSIIKAPQTVKKFIGFTLIPQAGVAIGLSLIAADTIPGYGKTIRTVILCSTLIYELIGPVLTKIALKKAGEIKAEQTSIAEEQKV